MKVNGARLLPGHLDGDAQVSLLEAVLAGVSRAPFFTPAMPRTGKLFSVGMTNFGPLGWVSDRDGGYRYQATHPVTGAPWPPIPDALLKLWESLADYPSPPEACLANHYVGAAKMGSHRDQDEQDLLAPVLSVSLGDEAIFHVGGKRRDDPKARVTLRSGDVLLLEGESRLAYHGIDRINAGTSELLQRAGLPEGGRLNLTLRRVTPLSPARLGAAKLRLNAGRAR